MTGEAAARKMLTAAAAARNGIPCPRRPPRISPPIGRARSTRALRCNSEPRGRRARRARRRSPTQRRTRGSVSTRGSARTVVARGELEQPCRARLDVSGCDLISVLAAELGGNTFHYRTCLYPLQRTFVSLPANPHDRAAIALGLHGPALPETPDRAAHIGGHDVGLALMLDDPYDSRPRRVQELQLDSRNIVDKAPIGLRSCYQFAACELSAPEDRGSAVGIARGDEKRADCDNRDEKEDSHRHQQFSRDGHTPLRRVVRFRIPNSNSLARQTSRAASMQIRDYGDMSGRSCVASNARQLDFPCRRFRRQTLNFQSALSRWTDNSCDWHRRIV